MVTQREASDFGSDVQRRTQQRGNAEICDLLLAAGSHRKSMLSTVLITVLYCPADGTIRTTD